ncbi:MAG TPA: hypothetical protein VHE35_24070 [Kofleriaceae bacterium]|nr:hypothetical protein [Kofleriaceae bacterium]
MRTTAAVALAATLAALPACLNSGYIPQARNRVAVVMINGAPTYVRDGQLYQQGFLGSGLMRAVQGNPAAERAAREFHDRQKSGLLLAAGGLACSLVAAVKLGADLSKEDENGESPDHLPTSALVSVGCLVASMVGAGYIITAEPYRYDAINIFNDTTPAFVPAAPGAPGAYATPPPSLRMPD